MEDYNIIYDDKLIAEPVTLEGEVQLNNFYHIGESVYRSDQPSSKCFQALERFGIKEVLNLRRFHSDVRKACQTDLKLHHIRTRATRLSFENLLEAMHIIRDRTGPILFHCWHGSDRTGAVAAMYRMVFQGIPKQQAIDEMVEGIFGFHMVFDNIIDTIEDIDIMRLRKKLII